MNEKRAIVSLNYAVKTDIQNLGIASRNMNIFVSKWSK
jgi:hypothetical protein